MATEKTQVVVVGAGPGGYAAAFLAADLGLSVTMIDEEPRPGGTCLLRGCIPSKALLHAAKVIHEAHAADAWGVHFGQPSIDVGRLRDWRDGIVGKLASGVAQLAKLRNVRLICARAAFVDGGTLRLEAAGEAPAPVPFPETISFEHAIVATGSRPALPQAFAIGDPRLMDSTGALALPEVPARLLVIGGGYIGLEMGTVYASLGSRVTVVEMMPNLLPGVDRDLVRPLEKRAESLFEAVHLSTRVAAVEPRSEGLHCRLEGEKLVETSVFGRVLVAVGRRPNSASLDLERAGIAADERGFIVVDPQRRTTNPRVFAIGDVAGEPMLAHKASREGKVAAEAIAGKGTAFDNVAIPAVVFTDPEIAWCGLTETEAAAAGRRVTVSRFPWSASGRAMTIGRTEGATKLVVDPETERVLGVGIVGAGAGELIAEGVLAVEMAAVARDIADSIHPHPTLTETVGESAEAFLGHATNLFRKRR